MTSNVDLLISQYGGILPFHEVFYIRAVGFAACKGLDAFDAFAEALKGSSGILAIFELQEALAHAGAVSRFFWPSMGTRDTPAGRHAKARGEKLRNAFGITETHPLHSRSLRNAIEHFDERLDDFLQRDPYGTLVTEHVGPHQLVDVEAVHVLRLVDPEEKVFVLFGERHSFAGIRDSLGEIANRAIQLDERGGRLAAG